MWKIPLSPSDVCNATLGAWGTEGLRGWGDWGTDVAGVIGGGGWRVLRGLHAAFIPSSRSSTFDKGVAVTPEVSALT